MVIGRQVDCWCLQSITIALQLHVSQFRLPQLHVWNRDETILTRYIHTKHQVYKSRAIYMHLCKTV